VCAPTTRTTGPIASRRNDGTTISQLRSINTDSRAAAPCHYGAQVRTRVLCRRHRLYRSFIGLDRVQDRDDAEQHDSSEPAEDD